MKIAITADPEIPVPPLHYGGIERIIALLVDGYIKMGHEVTLFANKDSVTAATLIPYQGKTSHRFLDILKNAVLINSHLFPNKYDIIHSFGRLLYIIPQLPRPIPKLMSYQREPTLSQIKKASWISAKNTLAFTGCSGYISKQILPIAPSYPIFNGVNLQIYDFKPEIDADAPLIFLGRIEPIKGTHIAIDVALATGKKLIIAGNVPSKYQNYFNTQIKPKLNDQISYIGPVNDEQKNKLLGQTLAFLMPIEWDEPFGIVMAEAMACGTPVIAFNRGSVPEVVINGRNGYRCNTIEEMITCVKKVDQIDRNVVRRDAERRFSAKVIVEEYLTLYKKLINESGIG
ncbi:glycosyltransferase family 4 protein [Pedobacter sp. AW1-32]|uniref:glycosyltransferase family 4 protein n=1 Tax=Pedobacter sp. AW1-32 TaxID=3383026 RepID=UPI003FED9B99